MDLFYIVLWLLLFTVAEGKKLDVTDIRLVGGSGPYEGRVEIQIDGVWGTVCDEGFHIHDATVMCRMMELSATGFLSKAHFGQGIGPIFAQKFHCYGSETNIRDCRFDANVICSHPRDVSIICSECGQISITNGGVNSISADGTVLTISCNNGYQIDKNTSTCQNGSWSASALTCTQIGYPLNISDIRLANGVGISDGRVEVRVNNTWGRVCGNGFGTNEGRIICNMLGFPDLYRVFNRYNDDGRYYSYGSGQVYMDDVDCRGTESHINNCSYSIVPTCNYRYPGVVVICKYPINSTDMRLEEGTGIYDGRVEISRNGIWGTVCSRHGSSSYITSDAMETLCRMMSLNLTMSFRTAVYGQSSGTILTGYLHCNGPKDSINECTTYPPSRPYCSHSYDLSLVCTPCGQPHIQYGYLYSVNGTEFIVKCNNGYIPEEYKLHCLSNGTWIMDDICSLKYTYPLKVDSIRLSNSKRPSEGRVEILVDGSWGTVCDNSFSNSSANVICQMLGLQIQTYYTDARMFGSGTGQIYVDNLHCNGSELHINNCSYNVENNCTHTEDVSVICTGYQLNITDIRLAGTSSLYYGRVELEVNGTWGTIGHYQFDQAEALVVSRMLGLEYYTFRTSAVYGQGSGPIYVDRLECGGSETDINQCRYSVDNYYNTRHNTDVSIVCWGNPLNITDIRLAGTSGPYHGRVEVEVNGTWGTIGDDNFHQSDGVVVCRMLGLEYESYLSGAAYGQGSGPIYVDQLYCRGSEAHIDQCKYLVDNPYNKQHNEDVAVICSGYQLNITNIRLAGTSGPYHGRVELEVNKTWGTIGHDNFGSYEASVICHMLGLKHKTAVRGAAYGQGSGPIYVDRLNCRWTDTHIDQCKYLVDNPYNTQHNKDVSVICWGPDLNITAGRLANGTGPYDGRAEIKVGDTWGTICDENFDIIDADVFCRLIGLKAVRFFTGALYGEGSGPVFIDQLFCNQNDALSNCQYLFLNECKHEQDVSVVCNECGPPEIHYWDVGYFSYNGTTLYADCSYYRTYLGTLKLTCDNNTQKWTTAGECQEYTFPLNVTDIRLADGPTATNGRVEIKSLGTWGTICDDGFGMTEANAICNMIGYPPAFAFFRGAFYGEGTGPIFVDDLSCGKNATDINHCTYITYDNCFHTGDISVNCTECGDPKPENGGINSSSTNYGAVVQVTCDQDFKLIGEQIITCEKTGSWSDEPKCELIDCGDPTPEHGSSNVSSTIKGSVVYIDCDEGYNMSGDAIVTCQTDETWTNKPVCEIIDCGTQNPTYADVNLPNNKTTYGETVLISCWPGHTLIGNPTISCLSDGNWETMPTCEIVDCGVPVPNKASANSTDTTYKSVVEITCDPGYNMTGNATIICLEDGTWSDNPICDATDCGVLSVPHSTVNDSQGTLLGSTASIKCDQGYDLNGTSIAICLTSVRGVSWNYSAACMLQVCKDPTPDNGKVSDTHTTNDYKYGNHAKIACNVGYNIVGDSVITCNDGGIWSDAPVCEMIDCGIPTVPDEGYMDSNQGTMYNAEITFGCSEGYLLVGEEMTTCGEDGEWSNEPPVCVAKSEVGGYCIDEHYCLMEDSRCVHSVCKCDTGIYDNRTKKCDTMPLMPFGAAEGDTSVTKNNFCGPKITFEPGFPVFNNKYTNLYVCLYGFVSVDTMYTNPTPPSDRNSLFDIGQQRVILAPFYGPIDRSSGQVWYRTYDILNSHEKMKADADLITSIEEIVKKYGNLDSFDASFVLIATWHEAKAIGSGFDRTKTSTFQVVFISDGTSTYAFYIYGHGLMQWVYNLSDNPPVWIGSIVTTLIYSNAYSFSEAALHLDFKLRVTSSIAEVSGLIFRSLNSQGKQSKNYAVECIRWYYDNFQHKKHLDYIASLTPECPCDIRLSRFDPLFWQIGLQRWRTDIRYACVDMLHVGNSGQYGKSCCYDLRTQLWVYERPHAAGFQLYDSRQYPLKHITNDVKPKNSCCSNSSDYCNLYYELRPIGSCYRTSPYNFGSFWGDPHFSTLDSMNFTFNGLGEYTLLQVKTSNCSFELQARTERAVKQDGSLSDATVFAAFAAKDSTNSSVHVERNTDKNGLNLYGNKIDLTNQFNAYTDLSNPFVWTSEDNNLTISKRNESVNIFFPSCGISLMVSINIEMLTLTTFVPEKLKNITTGLLGNYDDNPYNDFAFPNGTVLDANLTEREVYRYAKTWAINPNNSAFVYDGGKTHEDFHNESYMPRFLDEVGPELRVKAVKLCNGSQNIECIFDYVFTEKEQIAKETLKIKEVSQADKVEIGESVPTLTGCPTVSAVKGQNVSCKFNASDEVYFVSNNVNAVLDRQSSTITYFQNSDDPVDIRIASTNQNNRSSPTFPLEVRLCTGCSGHGLCTNVTRKDARGNDHFRYLTCECEPQYEGIDCEQELDGCATNPCSWNRTCERLTAEEQMAQNRSYKCGPCPDGFRTDSEDECIDIDECTSGNVNCEHNCTNLDGGFKCSCYYGYRISSLNASKCRDINECEEKVDNCDHLCNNTEGGFTCHCVAGYEFNSTSGSCLPSDDVCTKEQKNACAEAHGCTKENGDSACFCTTGYELDENGSRCIDIDECNRSVCPQDCINTNGSFECVCYKGYVKEGVASCIECDVLHWGDNCENICACNGRGADRCDPVRGCICEAGWYGDSCNEDIDECESMVQACNDTRRKCVNNLGSYSCECKQGFYENEESNCEDIDECSDLELKGCLQECENTVGGYSCTCRDGYKKNSNTTCIDIDECDLETDNCEQICQNHEGFYSCICHYGYKLNDDRRTCSKISDLCLTINNLSCSHFCLPYNAECGCRKGFILGFDNETCTDLNECTDIGGNRCDVDATCTNTPGSYLCNCPVGKRLENDGRTCSECDDFHFGANCSQTCSCLNGACDKKTGCLCDSGWAGTRCDVDIDECATKQLVCLQDHGVCVNLLGSAYCSCETGYLNSSGGCQDIDECATDTCDQLCSNTDGSFTCTCEKGFVLKDKCIDIDECGGIHGCDQICENTVGSYRCVCEDGFRLNLYDRKSCLSQYECGEEENNNCTGHSSCHVKKGTAYCTCHKGFQNIGGVCKDVDECITDPCSHNCTNTDGSFVCSCNLGYSLSNDAVTCQGCGAWTYGYNCESSCPCIQHNTRRCDSISGNCVCNTGWTATICNEDVNECMEETVCSTNSVCENNNGSFACKCDKGYFKTGGGNCDECDHRHFGENCVNNCACNFENTEDCHHETGQCICRKGWTDENCTSDIDECTDIPNICDEKQNSTCKNSIGSFVCTCNNGFKEASGTCEDINECLDKTINKCDQICENVPGSFACKCKTGFRLQNDTQSCKDVDECKENMKKCEQNCNNTDGSYFCSCASGFKLKTDGVSCKSCDMWTYGSNCQSNCTCLTGNAKMCDSITGHCICKTGWSGTTCDNDVNECENVTVCPQNAFCRNLDGSYNCTCHVGFKKTASGQCKDIDECALNIHKCDQTCTNTNGRYICSCQAGYFLQADNTTCHDIDECKQEDHGCKQECVNTAGGHYCKCQIGYKGTNNNCTECTGNRYGENCTEHCNCFGLNSENKEQTCDKVTGNCTCKPNWKGERCTEDVNECENDKTLCNSEGNTTCLNTNGWYECDCTRGFTKRFDEHCVKDIVRTTHKPAGEIMIELTVKLDISLPSGTNLNSSSTYDSLRRECEASLMAFVGRFVAAVVQVIVTDIRSGSVIVDYTIIHGTEDATVASQLTEAVLDLQQGSSMVFKGQEISASSESYKDLEPCEVFQKTVGGCATGYSCKMDDNVPVCKPEEVKTEVNWTIIIGVSIAGLFLLITTSIIIVCVRRIIKRPKNKPYSNPRPFPGQTIRGEDDRASDYYKIRNWQRGESEGMKFPTWNSLSSRVTMTPAEGDILSSEHPYRIPRARITAHSSRD